MDRVIGDVAQLVEHLLCKQGVVGSIPSISTRSVGVLMRSFGPARCWRQVRTRSSEFPFD